MAREELRISILIKDDKVFLGAQASDCDPKMATLQGDLTAALERVPSFVAEANEQWDASPRNPKSTIPEPVPPPPAPRPVTRSTSKSAAPTEPAQPHMF